MVEWGEIGQKIGEKYKDYIPNEQEIGNLKKNGCRIDIVCPNPKCSIYKKIFAKANVKFGAILEMNDIELVDEYRSSTVDLIQDGKPIKCPKCGFQFSDRSLFFLIAKQIPKLYKDFEQK